MKRKMYLLVLLVIEVFLYLIYFDVIDVDLIPIRLDFGHSPEKWFMLEILSTTVALLSLYNYGRLFEEVEPSKHDLIEILFFLIPLGGLYLCCANLISIVDINPFIRELVSGSFALGFLIVYVIDARRIAIKKHSLG